MWHQRTRWLPPSLHYCLLLEPDSFSLACTAADDKWAEVTMGISHLSTSAQSEKPQPRASLSNVCVCVRERQSQGEKQWKDERWSSCPGQGGRQGVWTTDRDRKKLMRLNVRTTKWVQVHPTSVSRQRAQRRDFPRFAFPLLYSSVCGVPCLSVHSGRITQSLGWALELKDSWLPAGVVTHTQHISALLSKPHNLGEGRSLQKGEWGVTALCEAKGWPLLPAGVTQLVLLSPCECVCTLAWTTTKAISFSFQVSEVVKLYRCVAEIKGGNGLTNKYS